VFDLEHWNHGCLSSVLETALLGEGLLAHQSSKLLERQHGFLQSFDGNLLEKPGALLDDEDLLLGIDTQIDILPDVVQIHIVASFGNAHRPVLTNFANEMLSMDVCQPGVGINQTRKRRQAWQFRKSHTRGLIVTGKPLMRALGVVMNQEGFRDFTYLLKRLGVEDLETFLLIGPVLRKLS